jgi:hypothetical protein
MERVIKDGKVAVVISVNYGCGWSTYCSKQCAEILAFHPKIVDMVLNNQIITEEWMKDNFGISIFGSYDDLIVRWIPVGTKFRITEYDGAEGIEIYNPDAWYEA